MKPIRLAFIAILILSIPLSACGPAEHSEQGQPIHTKEPEPATSPDITELVVSVLPFLSYAPFFIAQEEGYFTEQGLKVEFIRIEKTSEAIPALAQGQIDVAAGFFDVSTLNAIARGGNIKYVSDKGYLAVDHCSASTWVLRTDLYDSGALDDLKNMVDKKAAFTPTSSAEYALDLLLKGSGISSADVEVLNIPLATRLEGLGTGAIDLAAVSDPWTVRMVNAGYGKIWHPWEQVLPDFQFSVIMFGPNLLEKNRRIGERFIVAYLKAVRQYIAGKTDRNVEIIAKYTQIDPAEVQQSCWMAMRPDGTLDLAGMADFQEWALSKGYLDQLIPVEQIVDLSFIKYANQALK
ncbi:MAG: ABC transporter substrate-binding protein [Anaerolineales bacterium]|nr:ABC transporter substrate-binding protein [Anaerolineales bacterium]